MNIRGTDPAALAAATDLFVIASPARDDSASEFRRALQPPPAQQAYKANSQSQAAAPREDSAADREPPEQTESSSRSSSASREQQPTNEKSERPGDVEASEQNTEETDSPFVEDITEEDVVAESLAAAVNQIAVCKTEKVPQPTTGLTADVASSDAPAEVVEVVTEVPEVKDVLAATQQAEAASTVEPVTNEIAIAIPKEQVEATPAIEPAAESPDPVAAEVVAVKSTETSGGIGVLPSAVVTPTATSAEGNATRPSTRGSRERSEVIKQASATDQTDTAIPEATAPTEIPPGSQMVNEEATRDKGESKQSPSEVTATLPAFAQPGDSAAKVTMTNEAASTAAPPTQAPDPAATATTNRETPTIQPTLSNVTSAIMNRLPAQALIRHAQPAAQENAPLHVDAARFLQRVTKAFDSARERGGEIRLRLSPPELGALRVEVNMQDQGLVARLEVETAEARAVLLENLPVLRERLAEQGLRLDKFDVELSQREPQQQGEHLPDQSRDRQSPSETRPTKSIAPRPTTTSNSPTIPSPASGLPDRQLNVIV